MEKTKEGPVEATLKNLRAVNKRLSVITQKIKSIKKGDKGVAMIVCQNCKYFAYRTITDQAGECRLNPPVALPLPTQFGIKMQSGWPPTLPESCCGQGVERSENDSIHCDKEVAAANGAGKSTVLV